MTFNLDGNYYLPGVITIPSSLTITAISQSFPMVITVSVNPVNEFNSYQLGQLVLLIVPQTYGMWQANELTVKILSVSGNLISVDVDSSLFDPFVIPAAGQIQPAMLAPSGSRNLEFSNITNNVPFQSLNNIGN